MKWSEFFEHFWAIGSLLGRLRPGLPMVWQLGLSALLSKFLSHFRHAVGGRGRGARFART